MNLRLLLFSSKERTLSSISKRTKKLRLNEQQRLLTLSSVNKKSSYKQGQHDGKAREYFYFVDHQGMLFMDDARMRNFTSCFKDPVFLSFFFRNVKIRELPSTYTTFPYVSLCGIERNYIQCEDLPIVFTHLFQENGEDRLGYGYHTGNKLSVKFRPEKLYVDINGRIYHPTGFTGARKVMVGLVRSQIGSDILSTRFVWTDKNKEGGSNDSDYDKGLSNIDVQSDTGYKEPPKGIRWKGIDSIETDVSDCHVVLFDNQDVVEMLNKERSLVK